MKTDWIVAFIALPLAAWLASSPADFSQMGFFQIRHEAITASGLIAFALCSACMVLATRWSAIERRVGGLDRIYMLHKSLGITAAIMILAHWMFEQVPRWLVQAGWLTRPSHGGGAVQNWQSALVHPASDAGLYLAYVSIALVLVALIRMVPYHWFRRLHKVFPVAFLVMVFHSVVLLPSKLWLTPAGLIMGVSALAGTLASVIILAGRVGRTRRNAGTISSITALGNDALEVECLMPGKGLKHKAGQFVIARFANARDPHPFTIASGGMDPGRVRICIKALGDDTNAFVRDLCPGMSVELEGPYGRFDFHRSHKGDQVWIGAGIGITPFLARLETLVANPQLPRPARLFFCAPKDHPLATRVSELCKGAQVDFQLVDSLVDGPLKLSHALGRVANARLASLWFCGPQGFGDSLERAWRKSGLHPTRFHREYFAFR